MTGGHDFHKDLDKNVRKRACGEILSKEISGCFAARNMPIPCCIYCPGNTQLLILVLALALAHSLDHEGFFAIPSSGLKPVSLPMWYTAISSLFGGRGGASFSIIFFALF